MSEKPTEDGVESDDPDMSQINRIAESIESNPQILYHLLRQSARIAQQQIEAQADIASRLQTLTTFLANPLPHNCANCMWQCGRSNRNPYTINQCARWTPERTAKFAQWQHRAAGYIYGEQCVGCVWNKFEDELDFDYDWMVKTKHLPCTTDTVQFFCNRWGSVSATCTLEDCIDYHRWKPSPDYLAWVKTVKIPWMIRRLPDPATYDLEDLLREALFLEQHGHPSVDVGDFHILI